MSAEDWCRDLFGARAVSTGASFEGETEALVPLVSCGRAVRVGWFESEPVARARNRHVRSFLAHEVVTARFPGQATQTRATATEIEELDDMLGSARAAFAHRAYPDLPNLHAESSAEIMGLFHLRERVTELDAQRRFMLTLGLANALATLAQTDSSQDFVIAEVIDPPESVGYVQFKGHPSGIWFFGESESRLYKEARGLSVEPEHESIATALRWFTEDGMANDFGLFRCDTANARFLLAEHALETLIGCHGLRPGTLLSIQNADFDTSGGITWWTEIP